MTLKLQALAAIGLAVAFAGPALADACEPGRFSGPYIGAAVGMAHANVDHIPSGEAAVAGKDTSVAAGGYVGYNFQCGPVVFGPEVDINYTGLTVDNRPASGNIYRNSFDWYGSVRGRLGLVYHHDVLVYATGGFAFADRSAYFAAPAYGFSQSHGDTATGYIYGGGIELARDDRWLLRAEVMKVDLGSETREYAIPACGCTIDKTVRSEDSFWTARIGIALKLGHAETPHHYEPLK